MIDLSDYQSIEFQSKQIIPKLFDAIEKHGGFVARDVYLSASQAREITYGADSPWIKRYFGDEFSSWDEVNERAKEIAFSRTHTQCSDAMRGLANNLQRQATPVRGIARHNLAKELTAVARLRFAIQIANKHDKPVYNADTMAEEALAHLLSYIYKFSPLNQYCPDIWMKSLRAYGEKRQVNLSDEEIDVFAQAIVALQKGFGIMDHIGEFDPNTLEDTQIRALDTNPSAAFSAPSYTNGKSKAARQEQLDLAYEYKKDPSKHGNVPYTGQRRIQQGGNVLREYFERLFPSFNPDKEYPTLEMFDEAMHLIASERTWIEYYCRKQPEADGFSKIVSLPQSERERQQLVENGLEEECILEQFKDGTWKFTCKVSEPNPWKTVGDDEEASASCSPEYVDMMLSKNRNVFAGSNPIALNKQSFVHRWLDSVREWAPTKKHLHLVASWMEPAKLRHVLTNMVAAVHGIPDSAGVIRPESGYGDTLFGVFSGDDKSGFDNFQAHILHAAFNCCILAPMFKPEYYKLLQHISIETSYVKMLTFQGMFIFSESMPSGEGATNAQDGFISAACGLTDISLRTGVSPEHIMREWAEFDTGMVDQGDDYESPDQAGLDGEMKQDTFSKFGVKLSVPKSLISDRAFEYTRLFSDCNWRVYEAGVDEHYIACHAPIEHSLVKVNFGETQESKSPAIDEVSQINRCGNCQYHPNFVDYMLDMVEYTQMGMGTKPQWYVPQYNLKEWRAAGAPEAPSKFHVWIGSPQELVKVASKEASKMDENIKSITDTAWQARFDDTSSFESLRVVKVLNAIQKGDQAELNRLKQELVFEPIKEISRKYAG